MAALEETKNTYCGKSAKFLVKELQRQVLLAKERTKTEVEEGENRQVKENDKNQSSQFKDKDEETKSEMEASEQGQEKPNLKDHLHEDL